MDFSSILDETANFDFGAKDDALLYTDEARKMMN